MSYLVTHILLLDSRSKCVSGRRQRRNAQAGGAAIAAALAALGNTTLVLPDSVFGGGESAECLGILESKISPYLTFVLILF